MALCQPRDAGYRVAIIKVIGHNLDAIVCDTPATACKAIDYLKAQKLTPQTFLPIDGLFNTTSVDNIDRYASL